MQTIGTCLAAATTAGVVRTSKNTSSNPENIATHCACSPSPPLQLSADLLHSTPTSLLPRTRLRQRWTRCLREATSRLKPSWPRCLLSWPRESWNLPLSRSASVLRVLCENMSESNMSFHSVILVLRNLTLLQMFVYSPCAYFLQNKIVIDWIWVRARSEVTAGDVHWLDLMTCL